MYHTIVMLLITATICSCQTAAFVPGDEFELSINEIVADPDQQIAVLTISCQQPCGFTVSTSGDLEHSTMPKEESVQKYQGEVILSEARIPTDDSKSAYIQTLIRTRVKIGHAGGTRSSLVPIEKSLEEYFQIVARRGNYKLHTPITIAQFNDQPVTLTVGRSK